MIVSMDMMLYFFITFTTSSWERQSLHEPSSSQLLLRLSFENRAKRKAKEQTEREGRERREGLSH